MNPELDNHAWACLGDEPESERHMPVPGALNPQSLRPPEGQRKAGIG